MNRVICVVAVLLCGGCATTIPIHDPIYPAESTSTDYALTARSGYGIHQVRLYETVSQVDSTGTVTSGSETLLNSWDYPAEPNTITVSHTVSGHPQDSLVTYRYWVQTGRGFLGIRSNRSHPVTYAVRPYPVPDQPIPVYAQGEPDKSMDVVFIPDTDITNMNTFRGHCRLMIIDAVFDEPSIPLWAKSFNFYINPSRGTATDFDSIATAGTHQVPTNWANISFAEGKVLMHQNNLRDYASGGLFSTEQQNRGTMMHESGHALFSLADEYPSGAHWEEGVLPNNWNLLVDAQNDAPSRHKAASDARQMGTSGWFKICADNSQMDNTGLIRVDYDDPCVDHVRYELMGVAE